MLAARDGHADACKKLLEGEGGVKADANAVDDKSRSALGASAAYGHLDVVRILLKHGADPHYAPNKEGKEGRTALMRACQYGHASVVKELCSLPKDPPKEVHRVQALDYAKKWHVAKESAEMVAALEQCAQEQQKSPEGEE